MIHHFIFNADTWTFTREMAPYFLVPVALCIIIAKVIERTKSGAHQSNPEAVDFDQPTQTILQN